MTARTAERITGMVVRTIPPGSKRLHYGLYPQVESDTPLHSVRGAHPGHIIKELVDWNYARVRNQVITEQNYRCWSCYRITGLSCDHIKPRSHDRSDDRLNLRGLCAACHELHTRNQRIEPHPKMLELMSKIGLQWCGEWSLGCQSYGWGRINP